MRRLLPILAVLVAAASAGAATPSDGTVSAAAPTVSWTGTVTESYVSYLPMVQAGDDAPCNPPSCDTFTLTVADGGDLTIAAEPDWDPTIPSNPTGGGKTLFVRVHKPDGSITSATGAADKGKPLSVKIKGAKPGAYAIDYADNHVGPPGNYKASATLKVAGGAAVPAPAPAPAAPAAPAPKQDLSITVKAAKRGKRVAVTVKVSRAVKSVVAKLRRGKKVVATAKAGATAKTAKLSLKVAKKGTYKLTVVADDGAGVQATRTVSVKVR